MKLDHEPKPVEYIQNVTIFQQAPSTLSVPQRSVTPSKQLQSGLPSQFDLDALLSQSKQVGYKLDWKQPDLIDLTEHRAEYRNLYLYAFEFEKQHDIFGETIDTRRMTKEDKLKLDYFKPQLVVRYIQKQINEICLAIKQETKLNESFRDEFAGVRAFKFFT